MKKILFLLGVLFLLVPFISSTNLDIEKTSTDEVLIMGVDSPALFDLSIKNNGAGDSFMFYSFFSSNTLPKGTVTIQSGETKDVVAGVYPREDLNQLGRMKFDLYIKGSNSETKFPLMVNVIKLEDAFEIGAEDFQPDSNVVSVYVRNAVNFQFNNLEVKLKSPFFEEEKTFSLGPYQKEVFEINVDKEDFKKLMAGFYTIDAEVTAVDETADVEGTLRFVEKDIVTSFQNEYGFIIYSKIISKVNEGNVVSSSTTTVKKNILSRLFTTFSPEPDVAEREGVSVYYTWEKQIEPGEELRIVVKTNWLLPLLIILLIIAAVVLAKQFSRTNVSVRKKVSFVRAKGGEFALKVSVVVRARKYIERVNLIDRIPYLAKLHDKFGGEVPKKVDEKHRKIEWYFDNMNEGETRVVSYVIYSKVGVLGKFSLPTATAVYEREGELHEAESNRAFFIAEQPRKPIED